LNFIEKAWSRELSRGKYLFDSNLFRLASYRVVDENLLLSVENTTYKEFVGTRHNSFKSKFGREFLANPLSVGAIVVTTDRQFVLGRRRGDLDLNPNKLSVPAGVMDRKRDVQNGHPNAFGAIVRELTEETGLLESEIEEIDCLGLVYMNAYSQYFMPFGVVVNASSKDVESRIPLEQEFQELSFFDDEWKVISKLLKSSAEISETCLANLLLYVSRRYGVKRVESLHLKP
jgi:8-oxo-dGTP pyrophosphatase MutT (NUDIX family)